MDTSITKKQVRKAGNILRTLPEEWNKPSLTSEQENALNVLSQWRAVHVLPLSSFNSFIRMRLASQRYGASLIGQRLKRLPSIVDKLKRFEQMQLDRIQDIAGIRVILDNVQSVQALQADIIASPSNRALGKVDDYIATPKSDGYRSVHIVLKCLCDGVFAELPVELQIRTQLQHLWGTAVETLGMLTNSSIKTGKGSKEHEEYFKLVSALFSLKESMPVLKAYEGISQEELIRRLVELDSEVGVTQKLTATAKAVDDITNCTSADYYVVQLNVQQGQTSVMAFTQKQFKQAELMYSLLEQQPNESLNTVLVSAGSIKNLKRAYPNFFLDTKKFVRLIENCKRRV